MQVRRAVGSAAVAAVVALGVSACGSSSGQSIDDVAASLVKAGVCDTVEPAEKQGLVANGDPHVGDTVRSVRCMKDGRRKATVTEFTSLEARDAVFATVHDPGWLRGADDQPWVLDVRNEVAPAVREALGDAVVPSEAAKGS